MERIMIFSERLKRLIREEVKLLNGVEDLIQNLHTQIELMSSFLCDFQEVSRFRHFHGEIKVIEEKIVTLAGESEMAINTFMVNMMQQQHKSEEEHRKQLCDALHGFESLIADIKRDIEAFSTDHSARIMKSQAHVSSSSASASGTGKRRKSFIEETRMVGREVEMEQLLDLLIEGESGLDVISIVGMGGIGKTTLATEAYNNVYVKNYFDCRAWASESSEYSGEKVLHDLLKSVMPLSGSNERTELKKTTLGDYLRNKRYLIVLDNLLSSHLWHDLRRFFPNDENGSRILLTTRNECVASQADARSRPLIMRLLNLEASLEILSNRIFGKKCCPFELMPVISEIMTYFCLGLPWAILFFAGLLLENDEEYVLSNLKRHDSNAKRMDPVSSIMPILDFSYFHLPQCLKPCVLYLAVFPENFEISTRELYQLWIAEGFIQDNNEAIAEDYLKELIDRGFIQVVKRRSDGRIRTCSIHDLVRDFATTVSKDVKLLNVLDQSRHIMELPLVNHQRFSIHCQSTVVIPPEFSSPYLHSFLCFATAKVSYISENFKFLRVLDLRTVVVNIFPVGIENLLLLRYLRLNAPSLTSIPSSICRLLYLYTLDMPLSHIDHTPDEIWKMKELRHLNFAFIILPGHPSKDCSSLENLNFLSALCPSSCTKDVFSKLPNLQTLRIKGDLSSHQKALANHLSILTCLESLKLVRNANSPLKNLSEFKFPPSLTHLTLSNTELKDDPMPTLEKLPNLQVVKLKQNSYRGRKLTCSSGGFPQLEVLHLESMQWLEDWTMETGAMPSLVNLVINPCAYLRRLPEELWRMQTFYKLELWWPRPELKPRLREVEDMDRYDIQIYPFGM